MAELDALIDGYLDGGAPQALAERLRNDPAARARYWQIALFRAALREGLGEAAGGREAKPPLRWRRFAPATGLLLAACLLLAAALAWLAWPAAQPTVFADGGHRLELARGAILHDAGRNGAQRQWRLESGAIQVSGSGQLAIATPQLVAEAVGTVFSIAVADGATRVAVREGLVILRLPGTDEEIALGPGASATRSSTWELSDARRWRPIFDAAGAIAGRAPVKAGRPAQIDGRTVLAADPVLVLHRADSQKPELLPGAVVDLTYHLDADAPTRQPPILGLHRYQDGHPIHYLIAPLPETSAGWHRVRLPVAGFRSSGDAGGTGWLFTAMVSQTGPGFSVAALRVLVPE